MRYYIRSWKKDYFLITPDEFKAVFDGFTFVISNTGVKQGYVSSSPDEIYRKYDKLYQLLSSGKRCVWSEDWETLSFSTGVTSCPENIRYRKTNRLSVPDFKEPSVEIQAFCVRPFKSSPVSKGWEISQSSQNTIGLEMLFPSKIIAEENRVRDFESLSDHATWNELRNRIKKIAPMLYMEYNGKQYNTRIRVSSKAKEDLSNFYVLHEIGLSLPPQEKGKIEA